jgi:hypothetical protein
MKLLPVSVMVLLRYAVLGTTPLFKVGDPKIVSAVTPNLFKFVEQQTVDCLFVPGITNKLKWNMSLDTTELLELTEYTPSGKYELKQTNIFGGSGILLHRRLVEKLPKNIWHESNNNITSEDILFAFTLTQTYNIPAYVIWNSALHHYKGGFDLYSLVNL